VKRLLLVAALVVLAGCSTAPGTGWSRAPDLSVYAAMNSYGDIAREQAILCGGFRTHRVASHWEEDFGAREAAVTAALVTRHGIEAVRTAEEARERRIPCDAVPTQKWRHRYERLLRLLETRMGLA